MSNPGTFDISQVSVDDISINKSSIDNSAGLTAFKQAKHAFDINHSFDFGISFSQKKMQVIYSCDAKILDDTEKETGASAQFSIAVTFSINNLDDLATQGEKIDVNNDLVLSLTNITYATSRGIIFSKCQATVMEKLVLPILSNKRLAEILQLDNNS